MNSLPAIHVIYHRVEDHELSYPYTVSTSTFEQNVSLVSGGSGNHEKKYRPTVFTFDDGHQSVARNAGPILEKHGCTGVLFITTDWIGNRPGFMDWSEIRALLKLGHTIGSHGRTHAFLTDCSAQKVREELAVSKDILEQKLGEGISTISFPGGRWNSDVLRACVEIGYKQAFTSDPGISGSRRCGIEVVPRVNVTPSLAGSLERILAIRSGRLRTIIAAHALKRAVKTTLGDRVYSKLWAVLHGWNDDTEFASRT